VGYEVEFSELVYRTNIETAAIDRVLKAWSGNTNQILN